MSRPRFGLPQRKSRSETSLQLWKSRLEEEQSRAEQKSKGRPDQNLFFHCRRAKQNIKVREDNTKTNSTTEEQSRTEKGRADQNLVFHYRRAEQTRGRAEQKSRVCSSTTREPSRVEHNIKAKEEQKLFNYLSKEKKKKKSNKRLNSIYKPQNK